MTSLESIARERAEASGGQLLVLGIEDRQALVTLEQEIFPEDPWTTGMIAQELSSGRSVYFGVCVNDDAVAPPVLCGYAGIALGIDADDDHGCFTRFSRPWTGSRFDGCPDRCCPSLGE